MDTRMPWKAVALLGAVLVFAGCPHPVDEEEETDIMTRLAALESHLAWVTDSLQGHRDASKTWGWKTKIVVNCLALREWGTGGAVLDSLGHVVDCTTYPDPPSPPDPNGEW